VLTDRPYLISWATALAFEIRAAAHAQSNATHRWVFAVPQVWYEDGDLIEARPLFTAPVQPDEQEAITWMSCDDTDGIDYGRVPFTRRPGGEPVFDDPEYFTSPVRPLQRTPGAALHRLLTAGIPDLASHLPATPDPHHGPPYQHRRSPRARSESGPCGGFGPVRVGTRTGGSRRPVRTRRGM
ncbi:hypothetical protein, partial [Frankia casuarinae]|uniref:hypothetical protein n=2 Tax=Frankia TaxID=1854 RepID=UPI001F25CB29